MQSYGRLRINKVSAEKEGVGAAGCFAPALFFGVATAAVLALLFSVVEALRFVAVFFFVAGASAVTGAATGTATAAGSSRLAMAARVFLAIGVGAAAEEEAGVAESVAESARLLRFFLLKIPFFSLQKQKRRKKKQKRISHHAYVRMMT